jgi:2',3'-cyclic-nucleotide 2'-phosphodiesterase (5'-nucleotidase family)
VTIGVLLVSLLLLSAAWAEVVGKTALPLEARDATKSESTLGDLVADAVRAAALRAGQNADAAFVLSQQLRPKLLPAGDLSREALTKSLIWPEEQVVTIPLQGADMVKALEWSLSFWPRPSPSLLQVSGMTVSFRPDLPAAHRVVEVRIGAAPLVPDRTYWVAMPLSLAKGALGYYRVFGTREVKQTGASLQDALIRYVQTTGTISLGAGSRLRAVSPPAAPQ